MAVLPVYATRQPINPKEQHANLPAIDTKIPKGRNTKIYCFYRTNSGSGWQGVPNHPQLYAHFAASI
jgi:hypothetical protein